MTKRKAIYLILGFLLLVTYGTYRYFAWQVFYKSSYGSEYLLGYQSFTEPMNIELKTEDSEYITWANLKVPAKYFKDLTLRNSDDISTTYILPDAEKTTVLMLASWPTALSRFKVDGGKLAARLIKDYQITNDIELFMAYGDILEAYSHKINVLSLPSTMQKAYMIDSYAEATLRDIENITLIKGDYHGYILNYKSPNVREVNIINGDDAYILTFWNTDYFTDDLIKEIISSLMIVIPEVTGDKTIMTLDADFAKILDETKIITVLGSDEFEVTRISDSIQVNKIKAYLSTDLKKTTMNYDCIADYILELRKADNQLLKSVNIYCDINIFGYENQGNMLFYEMPANNMQALKTIIK